MPGLHAKFNETKKKIPFQYFDYTLENHRLGNGKNHDFEVLYLKPFSLIIPKIGKNQYVLIWQYRPAWRTLSLEFPAGGADEDEKPLETAIRELQEETGYVSADMTFLGTFKTCSRMTQDFSIFLANDLTQKQTNLDEEEFIEEVVILSAEQIEEAIKTGKILDSPHITAWYVYKNKYGKED